MRLTRGRILLVLAIAAVYFGWTGLARTANETAVLRIPPTARSQDTYVHLWLVEDENGLWIRAERPDRLWLAYLHDSPRVELRRSQGTSHYRASIEDTERTRTYVDALYRAKYGVADRVRGLLPRHTVPIRLTRS